MASDHDATAAFYRGILVGLRRAQQLGYPDAIADAIEAARETERDYDLRLTLQRATATMAGEPFGTDGAGNLTPGAQARLCRHFTGAAFAAGHVLRLGWQFRVEHKGGGIMALMVADAGGTLYPADHHEAWVHDRDGST